MNLDSIISHCRFADGVMRPIYDDARRHFVHDGNGYRVYGVWLIPVEEPDLPLVARADED